MSIDTSFMDSGRYVVYKNGDITDLLRNRSVCKFSRNGYWCVRLKTINGYKNYYLHRIIASLFIENPNDLPCINHIDGDKTNNAISNLEWCTYSHNIKHAYDNNLRHNARAVRCIETGAKYNSILEAASLNGIKPTALSECLSGRNKTCAKMHWEYIN